MQQLNMYAITKSFMPMNIYLIQNCCQIGARNCCNHIKSGHKLKSSFGVEIRKPYPASLLIFARLKIAYVRCCTFRVSLRTYAVATTFWDLPRLESRPRCAKICTIRPIGQTSRSDSLRAFEPNVYTGYAHVRIPLFNAVHSGVYVRSKGPRLFTCVPIRAYPLEGDEFLRVYYF